MNGLGLRSVSVFIPVSFYIASRLRKGADKSLARPRRKRAQKHVRDARDFNNIETRAVSKLFFFSPARQGAEGNSRHSDQKHQLVSFLVGLRTYQDVCKSWCIIKLGQCRRQDHSSTCGAGRWGGGAKLWGIIKFLLVFWN